MRKDKQLPAHERDALEAAQNRSANRDARLLLLAQKVLTGSPPGWSLLAESEWIDAAQELAELVASSASAAVKVDNKAAARWLALPAKRRKQVLDYLTDEAKQQRAQAREYEACAASCESEAAERNYIDEASRCLEWAEENAIALAVLRSVKKGR